MQFHHGPVSLRRTLMLLSLYAQHYNSNKLHSVTTSAATGARLTTLPRPVRSVISVQSTGARTYFRHVDSAAACPHLQTQRIASVRVDVRTPTTVRSRGSHPPVEATHYSHHSNHRIEPKQHITDTNAHQPAQHIISLHGTGFSIPNAYATNPTRLF